MTIVTVTGGRLLLSEEAQKHLRLDTTDKLALDLLPGGKVELTAVRAKNDLDGFFGALHDPNGPILTLEEIKKITEDAWAGKR